MMFTKASLRLAGWYVAILMGLSLAFSFWVYNEAVVELRQGFQGPVTVWFGANFGVNSAAELQKIINNQIAAGQQRIVGRLVLLNLGVLVVGGVASYWLARRTLQPIEGAMEAQKRFTADASHELRTPLAAMKTEIEVALRDPNLSTQDSKQLLNSNLEEIDRMSDLARGLLTLARSDKPPRLVVVHAQKVMSEVVDRLSPLAKTHKIAIKTELTPLKVLADVKSVDCIMSILLENAIKYSPEGTSIIVSSAHHDGYALLAVKDHGYGIKPDDMPHIFERFYRADSSRSKQNVAGHGLGLSIAQKVAEGLHGHILVQSQPGKGSTFTLRLPIAQ
jgi:signal transduction histidine kinase